jgi:hypothetical protein
MAGLQSGLGSTSMSETSSEKILGSLSPEHRARLKQIADDESVTDQVWVERVIMQRSHEKTDDAADGSAVAETAAVRPDAAHKSHAKAHTGPAHPAQAAHPDPVPHPAAPARQATERTIQREETHGAARERDLHADQVSTTVEREQETIETRTHGAQAARAHRPAPTTTRTASAKDASSQGEDERDVLIEERTEIRHDDRGGADTLHTSHRRTARRDDGRRDGGRLEDGRFESEMSAYHIRLAERAAAAEDVPLTIWLEQAILAHVRRPRGEAPPPGLAFSQTLVEPAAQAQPVAPQPVAPQPVAPPPAPQPAPITPVISETITGGRGIDLLIALILGAVLVLIILLILPWLGIGRSVSSAATPTPVSNTATSAPASTSSPSQATTPAAAALPSPPPASGTNVVVTTLINGAASADGASWTRRVHTRSSYTRESISERARGVGPARPSAGCGCYGAAVLDRLPPPAS